MSNYDSNAVGWLIVHSENKAAITHNLKEGKNTIGRASSSGVPDIVVENDKFVSRTHAILTVMKNPNNQFVYIVTDKSTNGTFVNSNPEKITNPVELNDGDTIQIGETKMVLKTLENVNNAENAANLVKKMDYRNTVSVDRQSTPVLKKIIKK